MAKKKTEATVDAALQQSLGELQNRYTELNRRKIQAETKLENARNQLSELQQEAKSQYGTDDIGELEAKLAEMQAENERKRREYQASLDRIEADLAQVDAAFNTAATGLSDRDNDDEELA